MAVDEFGNPIEEPVVTETEDSMQGEPLAEPEIASPPPQDVSETQALGEPGTATEGPVAPVGIGASYTALAGQRAASEQPEWAGYERTQPAPDAAAGETFMTPETTVAGQLEKILKKGSPLQDLAASRAADQASALGMMSSTGHIGAAQKALYDTALEVAKPDAQTAKEFKQQEQQIKNEQTKIETEARVAGDLTVQKAKIAETRKKIDDSWAIAMKGLDAETEKTMLGYKAQWDQHFKKLDGALARELSQLEIDANAETMIMNQTHSMINDYQVSVQQLMMSETFLDAMGGDKEKMHGVFNDMLAGVTASIEFNAKAASVYDEDFADYLDALIEDSKWA